MLVIFPTDSGSSETQNLHNYRIYKAIEHFLSERKENLLYSDETAMKIG